MAFFSFFDNNKYIKAYINLKGQDHMNLIIILLSLIFSFSLSGFDSEFGLEFYSRFELKERSPTSDINSLKSFIKYFPDTTATPLTVQRISRFYRPSNPSSPAQIHLLIAEAIIKHPTKFIHGSIEARRRCMAIERQYRQQKISDESLYTRAQEILSTLPEPPYEEFNNLIANFNTDQSKGAADVQEIASLIDKTQAPLYTMYLLAKVMSLHPGHFIGAQQAEEFFLAILARKPQNHHEELIISLALLDMQKTQ